MAISATTTVRTVGESHALANRPAFARPSAQTCAAGIFLAILATVACTVGDYGIGWDDYVQTRYGDLVLNYFTSCGVDRQCNEFLDLKFYGPPVELWGAALARLAPASRIEIRHLMTAGIALLSIPALFRFGRLLGRPWLGVWAAALLWLTPRFYGHAVLNSKDIPFAVGMIASLGAIASLFARRTFRWREMLSCGALLGLTVSVRPGGWLLLGPFYLAASLLVDGQTWLARRRSNPTKQLPSQKPRTSSRTVGKQVAMFAVAWLIMIVAWPWAHSAPLRHPLQAINMSSKFHVVVPVMFAGEILPSDALPRTYLLQFFLITTPLGILVLAIGGFGACVRKILQNPCGRRSVVYAMALAWFLIPNALFVVMHPNAYDGLRHFLFVLPAIALLAAIGISAIVSYARWPWAKCIIAGCIAITLAAPALSMVRLHPYQIAYFNSLVGGTAGASGRYDTEYWLTSYREAMAWIRSEPVPHAGPIRILVAANENSKWCAEFYAGKNIEITTTLASDQRGPLPAEFDYYLATTRSRMDQNFPATPTVFRVQRDGAVFAVVKKQ